jgi:hypothetical protein
MSAVADVFEDIGDFVEDVGEDIGDVVQDVGDSVGDAVQFVGDEVGNFVESASNELAGLDDAVNDAIPGGWATVAAVVITVVSCGTVNLEGETMALAAGEAVVEAGIEAGVEAAFETALESAIETVAESALESGLEAAAETVFESVAESLVEQNIESSLTEELLKKAVINTAMNGGDIEKGLKQTALSYVGSDLTSGLSDVTGSELAGRVLSNATIQLATTGEIDPTRIAIGEVSGAIGREIGGETDSKLLGKAAQNITSSVLSGKDPLTGLTNLAISEGINEGTKLGKEGVEAISDRFNAPKAETIEDIIGKNEEEGKEDLIPSELSKVTDTPEIKVAEEPVAGAPPAETISDITGSNDTLTSPTPDIIKDLQISTPIPETPETLGQEDKPVGGLTSLLNEDVMPKSLAEVTKVEEITPEKQAPVGGLGSVSATEDQPKIVVPENRTEEATAKVPDIQEQIDAIVAPEEKARVESIAEEAPKEGAIVQTPVSPTETIGGLNTVQQAGQAEEGKPVAPDSQTSKAASTANAIASGLIKSNLTKSAMKSVAPKKPTSPLKVAAKSPAPFPNIAAPMRVNIQDLIPIAKAPVKPVAPKGTLTPITNISGLTSLLKKTG